MLSDLELPLWLDSHVPVYLPEKQARNPHGRSAGSATKKPPRG